MKAKRISFIIIAVILSLSFGLMAAFCFRSSYIRFGETLVDLWDSIKIYFTTIFGGETTAEGSVDDFSNILTETVLPKEFSGFKAKFTTWFYLLFNGRNFTVFADMVFLILYRIAIIITICVPFILLLYLLFKKLYSFENNNYNEDTKPLKIFKFFEYKIYRPVRNYIADFIHYMGEQEKLKRLWLIIWIFNLNFASIIVAAIAYYLYFSVTFNLLGLYKQIGKLFVDLTVVLRTIPIIGWVIIGWLIFSWWRKRLAKRRLRHFEARNCGFVNELPIVSMSCGSMGKKKTTLITDMTLSQEVMFRQKALEILQRADMKFPFFPWICFENEMRSCFEYGTIYNLATVKEWVKKKRKRFEKHRNADLQLYGYDYVRYGEEFNDDLRLSNLFDVLETYALAYFIYIIESSLIVANFSVRTDNFVISEGNFPLWVMDFFPEGITEGRHAHILDFDVLRLGKKVIENNPNTGSFEFGVVTISEVGKERGNNLELKEVKKGTEETNQKNDLFNAWLKMCRHSATVDNFPFIKVFADEQRPESWGADARDLCDIINIASSGEQKITLPFYTIEEMLTEWAFNKFIGLYTDFRFKRGDNTLLIYVLKGITAALWRRNIRFYNRYGYSILRLEKERGTMDGKVENKRYYLMNKKIYARRFSTDCFSDYFNEMAKNTKVGLNDYVEYVSEKATVDELKMQNSYFINALYKGVGKN